ncbi:hypothetical protein HMPREF1597_04463 [Escherichia coli 907701]|nr:hypothetical protein HMPREF1597_04463 [Escherichia coli 907701]ESD58578.1 hypothetical protein HMPREF1607_02442 [Escherichia coli 908524]ESE10741.1 hypothetical protein HMPREF1615_00678 [Escherichia coli 908632]
MPDATLTRLIRPTGQCQTRRPDKAVYAASGKKPLSSRRGFG